MGEINHTKACAYCRLPPDEVFLEPELEEVPDELLGGGADLVVVVVLDGGGVLLLGGGVVLAGAVVVLEGVVDLAGAVVVLEGVVVVLVGCCCGGVYEGLPLSVRVGWAAGLFSVPGVTAAGRALCGLPGC